MIGFTYTKDGLSLTINGRSFYIKETDPCYPEVTQALDEEDDSPDLQGRLLDLVDKVHDIISFGEQDGAQLELKNNALYMDGQRLPDVLSQKIIKLKEQGAPFKPFLKFWQRVQRTPSNTVLTQLYDYLEHGEWPLLLDGRIMAYKVVTPNPYLGKELTDDEARSIWNKQQPAKVSYGGGGSTPPLKQYKGLLSSRPYIDIHSNSVPQGVGDTLSVPRNSVDDRRDQTCSHGLHCCSYSYTKSYGRVSSGQDVVLLVAVCPSDWVSVPQDYDFAKARVCQYEVLGIHTELTEYRQAMYTEPTHDEDKDTSYYDDTDIEDEDRLYYDEANYEDDDEEDEDLTLTTKG